MVALLLLALPFEIGFNATCNMILLSFHCHCLRMVLLGEVFEEALYKRAFTIMLQVKALKPLVNSLVLKCEMDRSNCHNHVTPQYTAYFTSMRYGKKLKQDIWPIYLSKFPVSTVNTHYIEFSCSGYLPQIVFQHLLERAVSRHVASTFEANILPSWTGTSEVKQNRIMIICVALLR